MEGNDTFIPKLSHTIAKYTCVCGQYKMSELDVGHMYKELELTSSNKGQQVMFVFKRS